jgi:hypothetical protein
VVLEILEEAVQDKARLQEFVDYQRQQGFVIAVDDFGAGHSNFDRIWSIKPDIVKIDRATLIKAEHERRVRRMLPKMVSLLKECGCIVLIEGVETADQAGISLDADADLVQGFYFSRPQRELATEIHLDEQLLEAKGMISQHRHQEPADNVLIAQFEHVIAMLRQGMQLEQACRQMMAVSNAIRAYTLDASGTQMGEAVVLPAMDTSNHNRYKPLMISRGAHWAQKDYFRRAVLRPNMVHISSPYLSLPDGKTCITLSVAIDTQPGRRVICLDVLADS